MSETERNYWIIVGSPENFERTRSLAFQQQGIKSRHRKKAERMQPGDRIVYYITGRKAFAAISTVTSHYFESHERIWESNNSKKQGEDYPFRVETSPDLILDDNHWVSAEPLARQMAYATKWPAEHWTLAFQGNVHQIPESDFELIQAALTAQIAALPD